MSQAMKFGAIAERVVLACAVAVCTLVMVASRAAAQDADHDLDHEHGLLHFSHPMVTESPSPDTKLRLDAVFEHIDEPVDGRAVEMRGEYEYAFAPTFSLAVVAPFDRITSPSYARTSGLGDVEISAKAASYAFAHSGVLLGGGMSVGLPTGSDTKGIGSGHLFELSPFVDAAMRRGPVEMVGFLTYSALANRNATDDNERELTFNGSALWRAAEQIELLAEIASSRSYGGTESAYSETFLAPGIKWRPAKFEKIAVGASLIRGLGDASSSNAVQISAFYHF